MFNALKYTQELEKAGFSRDQAEASLKLLIEVMNENFATKSDLKETELRLESAILATKSDLKESELRLESAIFATRSDLNAVAQKLDSSIREVEYKMTIKLGAMMTLAIGITATLVKIIPSLH